MCTLESVFDSWHVCFRSVCESVYFRIVFESLNVCIKSAFASRFFTLQFARLLVRQRERMQPAFQCVSEAQEKYTHTWVHVQEQRVRTGAGRVLGGRMVASSFPLLVA